MSFFEAPILKSPYDFPCRHWELDKDGQPTDRVIFSRRRSDLITPVPKGKKQRDGKRQSTFALATEDGLSSAAQEYNPTPIINELRSYIETWRNLPNLDQCGWLLPKPRAYCSTGVTTVSKVPVLSFVRLKPSKQRYG